MKKIKLQIELPPHVLARLIKLISNYKSIDAKIETILTAFIIQKEEEGNRND